jgi:hypothetical protein
MTFYTLCTRFAKSICCSAAKKNGKERYQKKYVKFITDPHKNLKVVKIVYSFSKKTR